MKAKTNSNPKWKDIQQTQTVTSPPSAPGGGLTTTKSEQYCLWIEDDDGVYQTSCRHSFEFMDGTLVDNLWCGVKFCPYCGKLIRQSKDGEL